MLFSPEGECPVPKTLLSIAGLISAFLILTAFTIHQSNILPQDESSYKKHSAAAALLCGSDDSKNSCYAHRMAKWLNKHGYKAQSAIMLAEMEHYPQ